MHAWALQLYRWLLERLYYQFAPLYDTVATLISRGHWFIWGEALIPFCAGPVLELGCGTGHLQASLATHGIWSIGLDRSPAMLAQAQHRTARLIRADSQALPCADQSFSTVVAAFPAPYIADPATLTEVTRVLKPGGYLVILLAAGRMQLQAHPLWHQLTQQSWYLEAPVITMHATQLNIIVARPPHGTHT
ncbi:MAG: class I SAM-dependent methyltransferase [Roseiflexaceae bacterium]